MRVLLILALAALATARVSYDGYQVWRLDVQTAEQHRRTQRVVDILNLDVWAKTKDWVDVMVSPEQSRNVKAHLAKIGVRSNAYIENIQSMIERDYAALDSRPLQTKADFDFSVYHTFEEIEAYLAAVATEDSRTSLKSLGQTLEGRDLWQLTISVGGAGKAPIWFDCGIHAREWITPATCLYGVDFLLAGYGVDADVTSLLDNYDVLIMPVNNPDGYAFTQEDRMWRKNRNQYENDTCVGIDINRNFDDHFGGPGTSDVSCSQTFRGPFPASELETQHTQAGIDEIAATAKALFSIHSYSQLWMYPYGYTEDPSPDVAVLDPVAAAGCAAITALYGTEYTYGSVATTIYLASSTTIDYSYAAGIVQSHTLELRDTGSYGFLLPEDQILPTAEETWAGLLAGIAAMA